MTFALLVDTETTGLNHATDSVVELAWARFDLEHAQLIDAQSMLITRYRPAGPTSAVHGIAPELLVHGVAFDTATDMLRSFARGALAIVAHNATFDRAWFPDLGAPWVCSMDFEWPAPVHSKSLTAIALAHGCGIARAHRALDDVLTLAAVMERARIGAGQVQRALRPKVKVQALVSYDERERAKAAGFRWEPARRIWTKEAFENETFEFQTQRVK